MQIIKIKRKFIGLVLLSVAGLALASTSAAQVRDENRGDGLPSPQCDSVQVPSGHSLTFHAYALGSQLYRWNGAGWTFVEPVARLFENGNFRGDVGIHYAGPTWDNGNGSKVAATRVAGCSVDATAIDWLLLRAVSTEGSFPFRGVTYIQRVRTVGGRAPLAPGSAVGQVVEVPYTAEYYFYRGADYQLPLSSATTQEWPRESRPFDQKGGY